MVEGSEASSVDDQRPAGGLSASSSRRLRQAADAARVMVFRGVLIRLASVGAALALVTVLSPADYGLLAVVRALGAILEQLLDFGLIWPMLRRREEPDRADYANLATTQLMILGLAVAAAAASPVVGTGFGALEPRWRPWVLALLASMVLTPLGAGARVRLERELSYGRVAVVETGAVLLHVGVVLAFLVLGRFAIGVFVAQIAMNLFLNLGLYAASPGPLPGLRFDRALRRIGGSSGYSLAYFAFVLRDQAPSLFIAAALGLPAAGAWAFAARLLYLIQFTYEGYARVGAPAAAKLVSDPPALRRLAADTALSAAALAGPAAAALTFCLPLAKLIWPQWGEGVGLAEVYLPCAALVGCAAAGLGPVALALRGWRAILVQHALPLAVFAAGVIWLRRTESGLILLALGFEAAALLALFLVTDRDVRPAWSSAFTRLAVPLAVAGVVFALLLRLGAPVLVVSAVPCALAALALDRRRLTELWRAAPFPKPVR